MSSLQAYATDFLPRITCRNINAQRHPIPDVPVLYLLEPSKPNLDLICTDLSRNLYADAYINFLSSIPRPLMEDFATQIAEAGTAEGVAQMYDQYLNFIVGEPDLFSLGMGKDIYWALNSAKASDEEIDATVDRTVRGLFSVVVTMGTYRPVVCENSRSPQIRHYTDHSMSKRRSRRNDSSKIRPQTERSYPQL